jgi:hypothetical protein
MHILYVFPFSMEYHIQEHIQYMSCSKNKQIKFAAALFL